MKARAFCTLYVCVYLITNTLSAQTINWANPQKGHVVNANIGANYGIIYRVGYGYKTVGRLPLMATLSFSVPSGDQLFDDFATHYGLEMVFLKWRHIRGTAAIQGIYRRFRNDLVTAKNFGAGLSVSLGVYKLRWFAAAETGFDKAIITHFQHSDVYEEEFPLVKNGWYNPATGGNFNYGLRTGLSFKNNELTLRLGSIVNEDFKSKPMLPFYLQLGFNYSIASRAKH
ncbi:hypothetical protein [Niabella hibiscisoli]|uniref:hypothetical protein n=1 Tax=Niabella hibiscisoli TaxID=1825928 RepID=UPI001F0F9C9F|nr:hypothetical protein [Niabella hibiscisoli]MCH5717579.1 hypothetical protein [Niabella hibiscisoli]